MRLGYTKSTNSTSYYVYKSAYINGKRTTVTVEKLGNDKYICETYGVTDAKKWAQERVAELNKKAEEEALTINVSFSPSEDIKADEQRCFNVGYLFLQKIFYDLGLDKICKTIKKNRKFEYDLTAILSRLIYTRILFPASKKGSFELSQKFIEAPDFELQNIYRALSVLSDDADFVQSSLYKNSLKYSKRNTDVIYYDCTNYYFEIEEASGNKQYGHSKENRPNPIVQMGLFMDADGIPLAFCINPGNTNEQTTLRPLETKLLSDFELSKFIVCTDAGLSSTDNRKFNNKGDRSFITTQSIKQLKGFQKEWCLDKKDWFLLGGNGEKYNLDDIDESEYKDAYFYKERWFNENGLEQRMVVTYSIKYKEYLRTVRGRQIERAKVKINNPSTLKKNNKNDSKRFIERDSMTFDGEVADRDVYYLNEEAIRNEEMYDGFYAVCTNIEEGDVSDIVAINKHRWRIEECFRIMKHEFKARPAFLSRDDRIKAHFMTCFIALIVFRFLEKNLDEKYTVGELISTLRDMNVTKLEGYGYVPSYTKNKIIDDLHRISGFDTAKEIIPMAKMRNICKLSKGR